MLQAFKSWHIPFVSESREVILEAKVKKNIEFNAQLLFQKKLKFIFQNFYGQNVVKIGEKKPCDA